MLCSYKCSPSLPPSPDCLDPSTPCDPLVEDLLGLYNELSVEDINLARYN